MVEKKTVEIEVSKEAYELMEGLKGVIRSTKEALKDGWQPGQDIPVIFSSALTNLIPAVKGADKIGEEAEEELEAFVTGLMVQAKEIGFMFYEKPQPKNTPDGSGNSEIKEPAAD